MRKEYLAAALIRWTGLFVTFFFVLCFVLLSADALVLHDEKARERDRPVSWLSEVTARKAFDNNSTAAFA